MSGGASSVSRRSVMRGLAATGVGIVASPALTHAAPVGPRVIDFRARPNTREYLALFPESRASLPDAGTLAQFVAALDQAGVAKAVFPGRQSSIRIGNRWTDVTLDNDYVAECVAAYPDRLVGLAGINPLKRMDTLHEIERTVGALGMKGVSIDLPGVQADDRLIYPIYYKCADLNVPVVITQGPRMGNLSNPRAVAVVADDLPELKIVCSHAIYPDLDEWIALAFRCPNVFIEASLYHFLPGSEQLFEAVNSVLQDKILYGSAFPFAPLSDVNIFKQRVREKGILDKVLYRNAVRVLGLS